MRADSEVGTLTPQKCGEGASVLKAPCVLNFSLPLTILFCLLSEERAVLCFGSPPPAWTWSQTEMVLLLAFGVVMQPINHDKIFV